MNSLLVPRRRFLRWCVLPACGPFVATTTAWGARATIASARLWPAQEYTRVILEGPAPIAHQLIQLKDPERVVLDLPEVDLGVELASLPTRVHPTDPFISAIRFGYKGPGVLRLVIEVKVETSPQLFALPPVAGFAHRLVLDLYPATPVDPLMALLAGKDNGENERPRVPAAAEPPRADVRELRRDSRHPVVVMIDPGHGGEDPGAIGRNGTCEKDVALAIAARLKRLIDTQTGMRALLTRDDDYFVPLRSRVEKARRVQADLFVSIHADAFTEPSARGSSVFALSDRGATSAAARWLARKENAADLIGGVNLGSRDPLLARTLLDLSQTAQINDSLKVGRQVLHNLGSVNALHKPAVEQAGFAVLKAPDIPSILVETAFISNPEEERKLRNPRHQARLAESMYAGIRRYFANNPPLARRATATG